MSAPLHVNLLPIWDKQSTKCYPTLVVFGLRTSESEQGRRQSSSIVWPNCNFLRLTSFFVAAEQHFP